MEGTPADFPPHTHHWTIAEANGPVSRGVCKICNAQREFANWLVATDFTGGDESSNSRGAATGEVRGSGAYSR